MQTRTIILLAVVAVLLGLSGAASAGVYNKTFDFTSADWGSSDWTTNGNAGFANDPGVTPTKRLRLTSNNTGQAGTAWLNQPIMQNQSWTISVTGQFSHANYTGADGMALIFQTHGLDAIHGSADFQADSTAGLGNEFLAIELDSYQNAGEAQNGMQFHTKLGSAYQDLGTELEGAENQGFTFTLNVSYDAGTDVLQYTFHRDGYANVTVTRTDYDMALRFSDNDMAYVGFWAGTGASGENHDVTSMTITAEIPEPATLSLLALGGLALLRRRK